MARQSFMWTALPNGYTADGDLRVSVLLSPRLEPQTQPKVLASFFPDWEDWPATLSAASLTITIGNASVSVPITQTAGPNRVDTVTYGGPDSLAWAALFTSTLFVRPFAFQDMSSHQILSYDTVAVADLIKAAYSRLAASGRMPTVSDLVDDDGWQDLVGAVQSLDRATTDGRTGVRNPTKQFARFKDSGLGTEDKASGGLARFQLFHTPAHKPTPVKKKRTDDGRISAQWLEYARSPMPTEAELAKSIDFHQIVSALNAYPTLLRRLGFVVDLILDPTPFTKGANVLLSASATFKGGVLSVARTPDVSPVTHTRLTANRFQPVSNPGLPSTSPPVVDGLVDLAPGRFELLQTDVDGGGLKLMNFVRTIGRSKADTQRVDPVTRLDRDLGAPALRTAGLMLVQRERSEMLKDRFATNATRNIAAQKVFQGQPGAKAPELWAEDLVRGYRIDIWDRSTGVWRSLCEREATYRLDDGAVVITPTQPEETTVRLGATTSSDPTTNQDLVYLHESLVSWTGWSLAAAMPGRAILPDDTVDKTTTSTDAAVPDGLKLETRFTPRPGSLPRLRFGRNYWIRARVVDLAGNSLPPSPTSYGIEKPEAFARPFLRYEPVMSPVLALAKPGGGAAPAPIEGESMDRIAVRTFNDVVNEVAPEKDSRRMAVPPQVSVRDAELHGMLDAGGLVDSSTFVMLATQKDRDGTDPAAAMRAVKIPMKGPLDLVPVETTFAVYSEGEALTYLPDPLARRVSVRFAGHPHIAPSEILDVPLYPDGATWPDARPFLVRVFGDESAKPSYDPATHTLLVPLPRGVRARLRLSMRLAARDRDLLGVWHWLTPAQQSNLDAMSRRGMHWMLTPWRAVEVVHAVQRPLIVPELMKPHLSRGPNDTAVTPRFGASCSLKSTDRLDLRAEWHEPEDRPAEPDAEEIQVDRRRAETAFQIKITEPGTYALKADGAVRGGYAEHGIEGEDQISVGLKHDLVISKQHEFHDTRYRRIVYWLEATTRFREFMPPALLADNIGGLAVPVDRHTKVTGPRAVLWVPSSAPPPAPEVLYVVPTFGWVRGENAFGEPSSWRRGGGLRVYLDRPWNVTGYGEMLAVVLPPPSLSANPENSPAGQPYKNYITQWGNDPIWLSPFVSGIAPKRGDFPLARTGPDPTGAWLPKDAPPTESDQRLGAFVVTGLLPPGASQGLNAPLVEVAPHDVHYDEARRLWYCDIEVHTNAYSPFIRLALARYQPTSLHGAHLSNVVLADIMPLAADRWLNITRAEDPRRRHVSVYGTRYTDTSSRREASSSLSMSIVDVQTGTVQTLEPADPSGVPVFDVWLEKLDESRGEDFGWHRVEQGVSVTASRLGAARRFTATERARARQLVAERRFDLVLKEDLVDGAFSIAPIWEGDVVLPVIEIGARYRLVIVEYEEYLTDDARPYDPVPTTKGRRIVFVEHVAMP